MIQDISKKIGFYVVIGLIVFLFILPIYHVVTMSFKTEVDALASPPTWIFRPVLDNYIDVLATTKFPYYLLNSLIVSCITVSLSLLIGVPGAYALSRLTFRMKRSLFAAILGTRMLPPICIAIPIYMIYARLGLLDRLGGLVIVYLSFNLSFVVWMMKGFFDDVPRSLEEAARIDGSSTIGTFSQIALPVVVQGLIATAIFCWVLSWNEFLYALVLTRRTAKTAPVGITYFLRFEDVKWGSIAAGAALIMSPVVLFSVGVQRYLVRGLTAGAVKE